MAVAQTYTVTPSSLSFTGAPVGMLSIAKAVTIYNTGATSLTINSYSLSPEFVLIYGWAPYVIPPGKQFAYGIKFAPVTASWMWRPSRPQYIGRCHLSG